MGSALRGNIPDLKFLADHRLAKKDPEIEMLVERYGPVREIFEYFHRK